MNHLNIQLPFCTIRTINKPNKEKQVSALPDFELGTIHPDTAKRGTVYVQVDVNLDEIKDVDFEAAVLMAFKEFKDKASSTDFIKEFGDLGFFEIPEGPAPLPVNPGPRWAGQGAGPMSARVYAQPRTMDQQPGFSGINTALRCIMGRDTASYRVSDKDISIDIPAKGGRGVNFALFYTKNPSESVFPHRAANVITIDKKPFIVYTRSGWQELPKDILSIEAAEADLLAGLQENFPFLDITSGLTEYTPPKAAQ